MVLLQQPPRQLFTPNRSCKHSCKPVFPPAPDALAGGLRTGGGLRLLPCSAAEAAQPAGGAAVHLPGAAGAARRRHRSVGVCAEPGVQGHVAAVHARGGGAAGELGQAPAVLAWSIMCMLAAPRRVGRHVFVMLAHT